MAFEANESIDVVCVNCESEYTIDEKYSEMSPSFCPYCGESILDGEDE